MFDFDKNQNLRKNANIGNAVNQDDHDTCYVTIIRKTFYIMLF